MPHAQLSTLSENLVNEEFEIRSVLSLLVSLYRRNSSLFNQIFDSFSSMFASSTFVHHFSTQRQKRIASLVYCILRFVSLTPDASVVSTLMQAIGNRLGEVDDSVRSAVIGVAQQIALIVSPEGRYDWPETNLGELDAILDELRKEQEEDSKESANEVEEADEKVEHQSEQQSDEKPTESTQNNALNHTNQTQENDRYIDPEEQVDIFAEDFHYPPPEDEENASEMDDEDSFVPYDLTEVQDHSTKSYFFIDEALSDLSSDNHATELHAWKEFHRLCCDPNQKLSEEETSKIMRMVIEMNGMVGDSSFWDEWRESLQSLIFRNCRVAMEELYRFIRKNGRSNLSVQKCVVILQGVYQACLQLSRGSMQFEEKIPSFEEEMNVQISKEDGFDDIRVANTKYRPSFFRKKLQEQKKEEQKSRQTGSTQQSNQFTENSQFVIRTLVSWVIRFPPRDESTVSYHFITLSLVFSLPVLAAVFDEESTDLRTLVLRYRYHASIVVRRSVLQFFFSISKYFIESNSLLILDRNSVVEWLSSVLLNDPDDMCRSVARVILSELR